MLYMPLLWLNGLYNHIYRELKAGGLSLESQ